MQLQDKDQTIANLMAENANYQSALGSAEIRLNEFFTDQARNEEEMNARIEVAEKLRTQLRDIEKEKRDLQRRYNEQVSFWLHVTPTHLTKERSHQLSNQNDKHHTTTSNI